MMSLPGRVKQRERLATVAFYERAQPGRSAWVYVLSTGRLFILFYVPK